MPCQKLLQTTANAERVVRTGAYTVLVAVCIAFWLVGVDAAKAASAPVVTLSILSLAFGSQHIGVASPAQSFTVSNTGTATLSVSSIAISGASIHDFVQTNTCGTSLAAGASCTIRVTFSPTDFGARYAGVTLNDNAAGSPQTVILTGIGTESVARPFPTSLSFTSQAVGLSSLVQYVILSNTGNLSLNLSGIALTGANAGDFSQTNNCSSSLASGANCTITVGFTPKAAGTRTATLVFTDDGYASPQTVSLSGTVASSTAVASISPLILAFGSVHIGIAAAAQSFTVSNTGTAALTISSIGISGVSTHDFAQTNTCGSSLAAGASCTVRVTFTPTDLGARYAGVTLADNAAGSPQTVALTGTGTESIARLFPLSLSFAGTVGQSSAVQPVSLNNTGNATLNLSGIALAGANAGDFSQTNNCGSSVASGANCTINVTFTARAGGARTATLTFTDDGYTSPQTVSLSGSGVTTGATASLSPSSIAFGNEPVDMTSSTETLTLSNTGSVALSISGIGLSGTNPGDFIQNNNCSTSLVAGGHCTITVSFAPSASGARTASLTATDSASGSPQSAVLSGSGTHDVILSWTASPTAGIAGYNIYRGTAPGGESSTPLNSAPVVGTTYADANVQPGGKYYYVVTAVNSNGTQQSSDSNETSATVPSP